MPREVAPGLVWTGGCLQFDYEGEPIHSHMCSYLIVGSDRSLLVDTGHPAHAAAVQDTLESALGDRPLDYVFPTHSEMPHAGNLPRWLAKYPGLRVVGDVRDYHLFYPEFEGRFDQYAIGDRIDLGDREFIFLEAIWRDLPSTLWGYDTSSESLFVADGFAYTHHHVSGQCAMTSEERPPPDHRQTAFINERALFWTRYVDVEESFGRIDAMFAKHPTRMVAPAHGGVIVNLDDMVPRMKAGMKTMKAQRKTKSFVGY